MTRQDNAVLRRLSDTDLMVADPGQDVRGRKVKDKYGDDIGKVVDLLVDDGERQVRFLLVEHGGFLGMGETRFLVPVDAISQVTDDCVHINHSREYVAAAPAYHPDLVNDRPYHASIHSYYGNSPYQASGSWYPLFPNHR